MFFFFFNFFNFFAIFLEIPIPGRDWMDRNDNFLFSLNLNQSDPILGWNKAIIMFFNFLQFLAIFLEFPILGSCWNGSEREYFFSLILSLSHPVLAWKEAIMIFFSFFEFLLLFFWNSLFRAGVEWIGTRILFFTQSQHVPSCFGLKRNHNDVL